MAASKSGAAALPAGWRRGGSCCSLFVPSAGNFAIQWNFSSLSIAVAIMTASSGGYTEPSWAKYALLGTVFAGAMAGMIGMGALGDALGRRLGMATTLSLVVAGALGSALLPWGDGDELFGVLAACRFVLGAGVGGIYPMAAASAHEGASSGGANARAASAAVGFAFFWQSVGALAPSLVALLMLWAALPGPGVASWQFRVLLGAGALFAAVPLIATLREAPDAAPGGGGGAGGGRLGINAAGKAAAAAAAAPPPISRAQALALAGTTSTWLLFDISCYGVNIFSPAILSAIFGDESLVQLCWHSAIFAAVALPASAVAIALLKPMGARALSHAGFALIAASFAALAAAFNLDAGPTVKFVLYIVLSFALNWGPNVTTYVIPAEVFPARIRGTFHGTSAAAGKLGAVIGTFMFQPIVDKWGVAGVCWVQVALSLLGLLASVALLPAAPLDDDDADAADAGFARLASGDEAGDGRSRLLVDA
jgi:PHS family inorganic phosphate transporter-like MFS transporter